MYGKAVRTQIKFLIGQKSFALVFSVLMVVMLRNFIENVLTFRGYDVISLYHPMKMLALSFNKTVYNAESAIVLIQVVPLLLCLPAALSLAKEQRTGQSVLMSARLGRKVYLWSRVISVFVVTTIVFSLPFLLEIVLNCVSFPLNATGDFYNYNAYEEELLASEALYQLTWLYQFSPYLYAVVCTVFFGVFFGIWAAATTTLSALVKVRFQVLLLLPSFLLLQLTLYTGESGTTNWYNYVFFFNDINRNTTFFVVLMGILVTFVLIGTTVASRKDELQ